MIFTDFGGRTLPSRLLDPRIQISSQWILQYWSFGGLASPELKIWKRRKTIDGIRESRERFTRLMNLKIEIAENWILLEADVIFLGTCSGSEVAGLDLDEGGRPGLVERERPWEMDGARV